ncbi:prephenate dehydratase [Clostridium bornimense]|uniref:Prephenate dehydratase n=1 Tax=Clostridium bornimense TaxID=1216932 RepID=W6S2D9_9CLOT|nr:prephenate dehydratase domain-containing protein [Clostridium bornimense]CDM68462.1 prephenate dehydratase [Clostridium bornimense]
MTKIITLGPKGTFSDVATSIYIGNSNKDYDIEYKSSINDVFRSIDSEGKIAIIPIENSLDGYVDQVLDLFSDGNLKIVKELIVPVHFAFGGNAKNIEEIKTIYGQFKTQGQCLKFLNSMKDVKIITTSSNMESYEKLKEGKQSEGAIIPSHMLKDKCDFDLTIGDVTDAENNVTRFIVVAKNNSEYDTSKQYRTSIVVHGEDKPGELSYILNQFSSHGINLKSIVSRPTRKKLGSYLFYIDIEGNYPNDSNVKKSINEIMKTNKVSILGSYYTV